MQRFSLIKSNKLLFNKNTLSSCSHHATEWHLIQAFLRIHMRRQQGSDTTRGIKQLTIGPTTRGIYSSLGSMELGNLASSSCFAGLTIVLLDS